MMGTDQPDHAPLAQPFRILSIEGGGILGAFASGALAEMEQATGKRIVDHFDLIAGTSTGGIIAIGLAMGLPAARIRDFYLEHGREIFPEVGFVGNLLANIRHLLRPKHGSDRLEHLLQGILSDDAGQPLLLGHAKTRLLVPAYDALSGRIYLFKTAHHPRFTNDIGIPAAQVALATAAAPTYFSAARVEQHGASYVDGGIWANCPALAAVVEATTSLGQTSGQIEVLNVGTTTEPFNTISKARSGVLGWNKGLITLFMMAQGEASRAMAALLTGDRLTNVNYISRSGEFTLDDPSRVEDLAGLGRAEASKKKIAEAVASRFLNGRHIQTFLPTRVP